MSLVTQAKILRVLQEQQFQRVGGSRILKVSVRVIAASNKDLKSEIASGNFREDLFYRINVVPVTVPALRDRQEDIALLVETFLNENVKKGLGSRKKITDRALDLLKAYEWPGNVRELKNLLERLSIMVEKDLIDVSDLPTPYNPQTSDISHKNNRHLLAIDSLKEAKKSFEKEFIQTKLLENDNNVSKTAKMIGVERSYLHKLIKRIIPKQDSVE
jgi:two-component system, NtrC family, nitrogen regulation response regulator NtrX